MFTGIVKELGKVIAITPHHKGALIKIEAPNAIEKSCVGSSISVNGICLTVTKIDGSIWVADVVTETMRRTTTGSLSVGDLVNIETPLTVGASLDGHFVQGHVDGVGKITHFSSLPDGSVEMIIQPPSDLLKFIVSKGSITVDGVSLTVVNVTSTDFSIAIIPHTLKETILGLKFVGDRVNLEVDILAKYVEKVHKK